MPDYIQIISICSMSSCLQRLKSKLFTFSISIAISHSSNEQFLKIQLHLLSIGMTPRTKVTLTAKMQSPKGNVSTKQNQLKKSTGHYDKYLK